MRLSRLCRRLRAAGAVGWFVAAQCLLPLVHSIGHRPDHSHGPAPARLHAASPAPPHSSWHEHGVAHEHGGSHEHGPAFAGAAEAGQPLLAWVLLPVHPAPDGSDAAHGAGAALHFGLVLQAAQPAPEPLPVADPIGLRPGAADSVLERLPLRSRAPRGPPPLELA
jgi:hypothetical protein